MKPTTVILIAGAGLVVVYLLTRPKSSSLGALSGKSTANTSLFGALGQLAGGFVIGAAGTAKPVSSPGVVSSTSGGYSSPGVGANGDTEVAIVKSLDAGNIAAYDAQGTTDAPVFGIAGIDY